MQNVVNRRWLLTSYPKGMPLPENWTMATEPVPDPAPPADWAGALDGLRRELTGTIETLEALEADFPAWNWAPQSGGLSRIPRV